LNVFGFILGSLNWSKDRAVVADLRREVVRWLSRIILIDTASSSDDNLHAEISIATVMYWNRQFESFSSLSVDSFRALEWISSVQLESIFLGSLSEDIPVSNNGRKGDKQPMKYDRTLLTLEHLYPISKVINRQDVLVVFSEAVVQASRTAQLNEQIKYLFLSVEKAKNSEFSYSYSTVFQNVLLYRIGYEYKRMIRRLLKNRDFESEDELREWEIQSELISCEPFLWAQGIHWLFYEEYNCTHASEGRNEKPYPLLNKLADHFSSISKCILSGQVTIDFMKKVFSSQNVLLNAWVALGSPLVDNSLLTSINADIDNAYADNKTIIKVL